MAHQWLRLYSEFAHDPKIQMMSEADQRRYIMLLCARCSNGDVTLQDEEVTFLLRISNEEWLRTKAIFVSKNLVDDRNLPTAWDRRQFASDSSAARVARHRERHHGQQSKTRNVTVTPPEQNRTEQNRTEKPSEAVASVEVSSAFDRFWQSYPRKKNRGQAEKAWAKIKPDAGLVATILAAVEVAKASDDWRKDVGAYVPYPSSWLNAKGWLDDARPACYSDAERGVCNGYNATLAAKGWPEATVEPYSPERAAAIGEFLTFGRKPDWVAAYFLWLAENLSPRAGYGFDWAIRRDTYLRAREGNFAALPEAA